MKDGLIFRTTPKDFVNSTFMFKNIHAEKLMVNCSILLKKSLPGFGQKTW